jgi:anti-sigma factor RsiW
MNSETHASYGAPCEEYEFDIVELEDGALSPEHARIVRLHLQDCARCRHWHAEVSAIGSALTHALPRPALSPGFDAALHARISALATPRIERGGARAAAESEHRKMVQALGDGWRWRTLLNAVAAASATGGALVGLQRLAPQLAPQIAQQVAVTLGGVAPDHLALISSLALALGFCAAGAAAVWSRSRGVALPLPFG